MSKIDNIKMTIKRLQQDKRNCQQEIEKIEEKIEHIDGMIHLLKEKYGDKLYEK